tara:strand:+ start:189 stop:581 length:393 start_codon:yes stop_codon:yes gene_type:complete
MSAETNIYYKMNQIRYKKVGRKYVQDNDPFAYEGLREGWWLVKVAAGSTSIRQQVYPNRAEITAAAKDKEDQLVDIIRTASEARPSQNPISPEALADWKVFIAKHGKEFNSLEYPSIQENAEKIIKALLE